MKRMKNVVLAAMIVLSALSWCTASAATTYTTEIASSTWSYTLSIAPDITTNATITAVTPADGALVVPSAIDGYRVVAIGNVVGNGCSGITSLRIPDSVRTVGRGAFSNCGSLGEVAFGAGVAEIGGYDGSPSTISDYSAFGFCSSLTNVTFGASLKTIGGYAFYKCTSLAVVDIPDSVTTIGRQAFQGCTKMTAATFGNGLTSVGYYAFGSCTGLKTATFSDGGNAPLSLGEGVFSSCTSLVMVYLPDYLVSMGSNSFANCPALAELVIPDSVLNK